MVKTQPGLSPSIGSTNHGLRGRSQGHAGAGRWSAPSLPADNRLLLDQRKVASSLRLTTEQTQSRTAFKQMRLKRNLVQRSEMLAIAAMVGCFAVLCAFGIVYVAAYATVAQQGREMMTLQADLTKAKANHEQSVQQLARLSNSERISWLAQKEGMVLNAPTKYVPLDGNTPQALSSTQMAMNH